MQLGPYNIGLRNNCQDVHRKYYKKKMNRVIFQMGRKEEKTILRMLDKS